MLDRLQKVIGRVCVSHQILGERENISFGRFRQKRGEKGEPMVEERVRETGTIKGKGKRGADRTRRLATGEKRKCAAGAIGGKGEKRRETERKGHWRE